MRHTFFACLSAVALVACGSSVSTSTGTASTSGSGGGSTSGTTGTGAGSTTSGTTSTTSTSTSGTTTTSGTSTSSSGAGGSSGGCYIDLTVDEGTAHHLTSICSGSWGSNNSSEPVGYYFAGGPVGAPHGLDLDGCQDAMAKSFGVSLAAQNAAGTGMFTMGTTTYTDANGMTWGVMGDPFVLNITQADMVGGVFVGTFDAQVSQGGALTHSLQGTFRVCHVPDELAP
jgi:hypothetical protein